MYEVHLAIVLAILAIWLSLRKTRRLAQLNSHVAGPDGQDLRARYINAECVEFRPSDHKRRAFDCIRLGYTDSPSGLPGIVFHEVVDPKGGLPKIWQVELAFNHAKNGFRIEMSLHGPIHSPTPDLALAFSLTEVSILDGQDNVIATLPHCQQ